MAFSIGLLILAIVIVVYGIAPLITSSTSMNTPSAPHKSSVRDFFLYLLMGGVFYFLMFDVVSLLFSYIEHWLPDIAQSGYDYFAESIRAQLSSLIVLFPVFIGIAWYLQKEVNRDPSKAEFPLRKFFIYLTLFLVSIALIADLITLINYYLDGELTLRFGMKVLTVFVVAMGTGSYWLYQLKRDPTSPPSKSVATIGAVVFLAVAILGFVLSGSPSVRREEKIDEQHVSNIQNMVSAINNFWAMNAKLPLTISELMKVSDYPLSLNPVTNAVYEYKVLDSKNYELCADFYRATSTDAAKPQYSAPYQQFYNHPAGHHCYQFEMKDRYPEDNQKYIESVPVL